ncbi:(d)CMP kinase [Phocicoccus pinnipedialis]|uniref:Cytidylate kinase n=1 Tax=Phocicoccus pinnipedialis TaxID=110845 RepID=A0A6V7RDY1_9BACL|nr:(d)CMP kinase [Jeotgalicoccus pinnipedialis]MBP1939356.1 cytidylate kinase [Jeotgalicoccus pinnipedialis]CAD2075716.1 Cytidylate kinase [Jeotgalicoccus pinnipedialis]
MINIAIDGPAAAGKSTIAKKVAARLGYKYLDTGAMYRAITLYLHEHKETDLNELSELIDIEFSQEGKLFLNDRDVTDMIRESHITKQVSSVAALKEVRVFLVDLQRKISSKKGYVLDGRDIGSVVLPDAELKIFMTATPEVRAQRRLIEEHARGNNIELSVLIDEITERDTNDMTREISPLVQAEDAVLISTDALTIDEVTSKIVEFANEKVTGDQ